MKLAAQIIADYQVGMMSQKAIGLRYGLSQSTISGYVKRAGLGKAYNTRPSAPEGEGDDYFIEPYRVVHPSIRDLVALKPFPRMRLTSTGGLR